MLIRLHLQFLSRIAKVFKDFMLKVLVSQKSKDIKMSDAKPSYHSHVHRGSKNGYKSQSTNKETRDQPILFERNEVSHKGDFYCFKHKNTCIVPVWT